MKVLFLQRHGFRAIIGADEEQFCFVEFYPNSPHFSADIGKTKQLEQKLSTWTKDEDWEVPSLHNFEAWKNEVERYLEKKPKYWDLVSQTFFFAGLSTTEATGALSD